MQIASTNAENFSPFSKRLCLTMKHDQLIGSFISGLIFPCCPFAIFWAIWAIIVDSFKRHSRLWFSHIGNEIAVRFPSIADENPSTSVMLVCWQIGVITTLLHAAPSFIASMVARFIAIAIRCCTMLQIHDLKVGFLVASARGGVISSEIAGYDDAGIATIALAQPSSFAFYVGIRQPNDYKLSKALVRKIDNFFHGIRTQIDTNTIIPQFGNVDA